MMPSILLLDCSSSLLEKLKRQGFNVDSGTTGFATGIRRLPAQIYERNIIIYNPQSFARNEKGYIATDEINNITPEYDLSYLRDHIVRGATLLIFVNRVADDIEKQREAYSWIPFMPSITFTKDNEVAVEYLYIYEFLNPLTNIGDIKTPVIQKLELTQEEVDFHKARGDIISIFSNRNNNSLGLYTKIGSGHLIIVPKYKSNDEIVSVFLNRIMPKIYDLDTHANIIERFISPEENSVQSIISEAEAIIDEKNKALDNMKEQLEAARRDKINTIKNNEGAVLILNYYDLAARQEDVALFYLYKVIEALEHQLGGEKEAKELLGCNVEWNLIGKLANESYADIRHAPKPGERIKEWNPAEIKSCFEAAERIIFSYLNTLF